jgi:hypothetical protein
MANPAHLSASLPYIDKILAEEKHQKYHKATMFNSAYPVAKTIQEKKSNTTPLISPKEGR